MQFNEDLSGLRSAISALESENRSLRSDVKGLLQLTNGCRNHIVQVPSGEPGMNLSMSLIGSLRGPAEGGLASFVCSYSKKTGTISVGDGSYQYPLGTNVDVKNHKGAGIYAYAVIKQTAGGGLEKFTIEISSATKDPTNMSTDNSFVQFSNVLLAEVVGSGLDAKLAQRRIGNLSLIHRLINGAFCLWPETTGGSAL